MTSMHAVPTTWQNIRVTVMGLGSFGGGIGLARYLATQGARVTVTDLRDAAALAGSLQALRDLPIRYVLGEHQEEDFVRAEVVFVNPAVPPSSPYLQLARQHGVRLDSEINLFVRECRGHIIGITGSVGKSTTTALLGSILRQHAPDTLVGGNIGGSLLGSLPEITPATPVVLELSSFQLEHLAWQRYSPPIAVVLNLAPNHLDRHGTMAAYQHAKEYILAFQTPTDSAILNRDDAIVRTMASAGRGQRFYYTLEESLSEGVFHDRGKLVLAHAGQRTVLCRQSDLRLPGAHNLGNAAAAAAAAAVCGVPAPAIARGLRNFRGLPHRLELVATRHGVTYYNDSKATTPLSAMRALEAFDTPVLLLAGGYDKGTPFDELAQVIRARARVALVYGKTASKLKQAIIEADAARPETSGGRVIELPNLAAAFEQAVALATPGETVLLSPACASYDQFAHYEARGDHFRQLVLALPEGRAV